MAVTFTQEQQRAIDLHGCNILVSAAAGSGKTAVLVERIVKMVCNEQNPVDIDRLLIVTFTNAAAAEMRERIAAGISKRLTQHPESEHIQRQATLLHNAQITTIDSFCLFLLRNHFNEIGLDPAFRIADEGEVRLMQQEALAELMEDSYASGSEAFRFCVEYFCPGGRESVLEQHILNLSRYAASFPWPDKWLEARKKDYNASSVEQMCGSPYAAYLEEHLRRMVGGYVEKLGQVRDLCETPDGPYMYGELVDREMEQLEGLLSCRDLAEYAVKLPAVSFGRLPSKKDDSVSPAKRELAKEMRSAVKDSVKSLEERFFATPLELAARQGAACREPVGTLIDLVLDFDRRMREKKQDKKVIDFSDMEHFALDILLDVEGEEIRPSAVAREYRQHFAEILTDEYQDSNLVQEYLLKAVSSEEDGRYNRFMVGDVKQSIYKFRLARPELFLEKYEAYVTDAAQAWGTAGEGEPEEAGSFAGQGNFEESGGLVGKGELKESEDTAGNGSEKGLGAGKVMGIMAVQTVRGHENGGTDMPQHINCRRIDLAKNFRSRTEVVDAVNDLFGRMMSAEVGGIAYDYRAALYPGADYPDNDACGTELLLVEKPGKGEETDAKQAEALAIAHRIRALRESFLVTEKGHGTEGGSVTEKGKETGSGSNVGRPAKFSDMVILLRTTSGWDEVFKEVLEQEGIPVYITSKTGYFAATEVQELLQLLRVLDNPSQDIPLFGVMKSIFGGFSEEEAARIRSHARDCSLYEAMKRFAKAYGTPAGQAEDELQGQGSGEMQGDGKAQAVVEEQAGWRAEDGRAQSDGKAQAAVEEQDNRQAEAGRVQGEGKAQATAQACGQAGQHGMQAQMQSTAEPDEGTASLARKAGNFLVRIAAYRECTVYLPIRDLLTKLIGDFGYLEYVTALPAGSRRRANVEMLLTKASDFEKTSYFGLFHFIRYIEQLEKYEVDYGGAEQLDENADVVRIMSIHKSKGLEFPITFVAGMSKRFNMQDINQSLILDMDLGLGTDYVDPERRIRNKTLRRTALAEKLREESLSEEMRLLYVAMTRAREKLIMTGVLEGAALKWERQKELGGGRLSYLDFIEAGSYLDFLLPVLQGTRVAVSVFEPEEAEAESLKEQLQLGGRRHALELAGNREETEAEAHLKKSLNAVYPYAVLSDLYTKTTVSELKIAAMADRDEAAYHTFEEKEVQPYIPMFRRGKETVSGPVRGNAYHRVMELLDFGALMEPIVLRPGWPAGTVREGGAQLACGEDNIQQTCGGSNVPPISGDTLSGERILIGEETLAKSHWLDASMSLTAEAEESLASGLHIFLRREVEEKRLTEEYYQAVNERKILNFLRTPLALRMWQAWRQGRLYREQPFVLGIDARRLNSDFPSGETVLIQGIIDVFFEEEDGLVLLDYKTDSVSSMKELWNRYETQLDYYQEAIEKIYGKPVKERILYSFHLEKY